MVKTNRKGVYRYNIEKLTKDWKGGSYFVLKRKSTMAGERPLIDIGYKYNYHKVLYFISIEDAGITKADI